MDVKYSTRATATGGRQGHSRTEDGKVDVDLSVPKEMGGDGGSGTNPEQLFAAGYSACFLGAIRNVAGKEKVKIADDAAVTATVGFGENPKGKGFAIDVGLEVHLPGLDRNQAMDLINKAHEICPYSNATRNNVDVRLSVV